MKKYIFTLIFLAAFALKAQVKIGGVIPSTMPNNIALQVDATNSDKGILFPRVDLISLTSISPLLSTPASGLMVYNKKSDNSNSFLTKGYYYWENSKWNLINFQELDANFVDVVTAQQLGYVPTTASGAAITVAGATKLRCVKWDQLLGGNGHVYCLYTAGTPLSWEAAYTLGKNSGGYLPVITSNKEWNFIKDKVITDGNAVGGGTFTANAWLGFNRDAFFQLGSAVADYKFRYRWITGEISLLDWGNSTASTENQFISSSASANSTTQNCGRINTAANNWSIVDCTTNNTTGLILEFNQ